MTYLIRYRLKEDGKRHTCFAHNYDELMTLLTKAKFLAENVDDLEIDTSSENKYQPIESENL